MRTRGYFEEQRVFLMFRLPFFGILSTFLEEKQMPEEMMGKGNSDICGTDGTFLYINPKEVKKLTREDKQWVLAHEIMHCVLKHPFSRRRGGRNPEIWNIAADIVVNLTLIENGFAPKIGSLIFPEFKGKSTEQVYNVIKDAPGKYGAAKVDLIEAKSDPKDPKRSEIDLIRDWEGRIIGAAAQSRSRGNLPAGIACIVDEILNPKLPWQVILSNLTSEILHEDYDETQLDKRFLWQKLCLPSLYSEGAEVAVVIDNSGSILPNQLKDAATEAFGVLQCRNVSKIRLIGNDTQVNFDQIVEKFEEFPLKIGDGKGGTDFRPTLELLEERPPALCVVVTDADGDYPEAPPSYPIIWIVTSNKKPPFGIIIKYEDFAESEYYSK